MVLSGTKYGAQSVLMVVMLEISGPDAAKQVI